MGIREERRGGIDLGRGEWWWGLGREGCRRGVCGGGGGLEGQEWPA